MATYVISDIHGQYDMFMDLLEKISLTDKDKLYILGDIIEFIKDFLIYEEVSVSGKDYLLVHAGLGNFSREKDLEDYTLKDLVWERPNYDTQYFPNKYVVTGHTPTQIIRGNPNPGCIYKNKGNIAIDCGAFIPNGRLAAFCLDSGEEFYSYTNTNER